jgi:hypothetical protein
MGNERLPELVFCYKREGYWETIQTKLIRGKQNKKQFKSSVLRSAQLNLSGFSNGKFKNICRIWGSHSGGYVEYYRLGYNAM